MTNADIEWVSLSRKYVTELTFATVLFFLGPIGVSTVPLWVDDSVVQAASWYPLAVVLVIAALVFWFIPRRVRAMGYSLRSDDLVFRKGIIFQRIVAVPYGRLQLVDVSRGPVSRALGLSQLRLVTAAAATGVEIPGLGAEVAESLRDHLIAVAETRRAGL